MNPLPGTWQAIVLRHRARIWERRRRFDGTDVCPRCKEIIPREGPDPCLGTLPGVYSVCCGHGDDRQVFAVFDNGRRLPP